ncbi:MAG TPA: YjbH domain-containing protein, partial [Thiotrichales bacterium]|nr:YjbH domain-containing protein [Thiotrichales bacterium]
SEDGQRLRVVVSNKNYRNLTQALGRTSRILLAHTPSSVLQFTLVVHEKGLDVEQHTFYRHHLVQVMQKQLSPTVAVRYAQQEQSLTRGRSDSQSARPLSVQSYPNWT